LSAPLRDDLKFCPSDNPEEKFFAGIDYFQKLEEIGKMLGGWIKSQAE